MMMRKEEEDKEEDDDGDESNSSDFFTQESPRTSESTDGVKLWLICSVARSAHILRIDGSKLLSGLCALGHSRGAVYH